jgi:hypothetical protein
MKDMETCPRYARAMHLMIDVPESAAPVAAPAATAWQLMLGMTGHERERLQQVAAGWELTPEQFARLMIWRICRLHQPRETCEATDVWPPDWK